MWFAVIVIERCYSNRPDDIIYTVDAYLLLLEKICGFNTSEASQDVQESDKNNRARQIHAECKNAPQRA